MPPARKNLKELKMTDLNDDDIDRFGGLFNSPLTDGCNTENGTLPSMKPAAENSFLKKL